ncbi:MAG: hypothetical protein J0M19_15860, partial [Sphingomonadales bacterium]|nr:hypothetical protein [Sphingomonadales bacterium]
DWSVYTKDGGALVGKSRVEKQGGGCTVRETWTPVRGSPGGSLNAPDLITGRWHQYWIDSNGQRIDLEGGIFRGTMVLAGRWRGAGGQGEDTMLRITYTPLDRDSVRQLAEFSGDGGLTWQVSFDYLYLRAARTD